MTKPVAPEVDLDELEHVARECLAAIGEPGSSTAPFMRALMLFYEEARPEVVLALIYEVVALRASEVSAKRKVLSELETLVRHSKWLLTDTSKEAAWGIAYRKAMSKLKAKYD